MKQSQMPWTLLLVGALTTHVGCAADGAESMQILRNQVPGEGCSIPIAETGDFQGRGKIDVNSTTGYLFTPLIKSFVESNDNTNRIIFVEGADVSIEFTGSNAPTSALTDSLSFRTYISGSLTAGGATALAFDLVTADLLADLQDDVTPDNPVQLLASVTIFGDLDGSTVESNTFKYPVEICDGCLTNVLGSCVGLEASEVGTGGACNLLQDGVLDCCTASDDSLVCPAVVEEEIPL